MAPGRTRRPRADFLVVWGAVGLLWPAVAAAQLGETFKLEERQAAVARVPPGRIIRLRLSDGGHAGGPLVRWTANSVTLGPYIGYAEQDTLLGLAAIDSLWLRVQATRRGAVIGGVAGGALGGALGATPGSLCPTSRVPKRCAQGVVTGAVTGLVIGGLVGAAVGSGSPRWHRLHPRDGGSLSPPAAGGVVTLQAPGDSILVEPRALALMRVPPGRLVRLRISNRRDLAGYVVSAGARRATFAAVVGASGEAAQPVSLGAVEGIWERGTARTTGSAIGVLLGLGAGAYIAAESTACLPDNACAVTILANGILGGLIGWVVGGRVGATFPKWRRRY